MMEETSALTCVVRRLPGASGVSPSAAGSGCYGEEWYQILSATCFTL